MKNLLFILLGIVAISCAEKKKESIANEAAVEMISEEKPASLMEESPIPVYDFDMLEDQLLKKKNDTTYVVNFFATWCKPCVKELPYFEQLGADYSERKLKVILVSLDFPENLHTKVLPFIEKYKLASEVVLLDDTDANTWIPKVSETWEGSIPATLFYRGDNRKFFERSFTYEELQKEVQSIL